MGTKHIPHDFLKSVLMEDGFIEDTYIGTAPRSDNLGETWDGVFEYEGDLWRVRYEKGNSYWRSEMGEWEDPFKVVYVDDDDFVECEEVVAVQVMVPTTKYLTIDEAARAVASGEGIPVKVESKGEEGDEEPPAPEEPEWEDKTAGPWELVSQGLFHKETWGRTPADDSESVICIVVGREGRYWTGQVADQRADMDEGDRRILNIEGTLPTREEMQTRVDAVLRERGWTLLE